MIFYLIKIVQCDFKPLRTTRSLTQTNHFTALQFFQKIRT